MFKLNKFCIVSGALIVASLFTSCSRKPLADTSVTNALSDTSSEATPKLLYISPGVLSGLRLEPKFIFTFEDKLTSSNFRSSSISFSKITGNTETEINDIGISVTSHQLTFMPRAKLAYNSQYALTYDSKDKIYRWLFTTVDKDSPTAPGNATVAVQNADPLDLIIRNTSNILCIAGTSTSAAGESLTYSYRWLKTGGAVLGTSSSLSGTVARASVLPPEKLYCEVKATSASGKVSAPVLSEEILVDGAPPLVSFTTPAVNSTGSRTTTKIEVTFNETMDATTLDSTAIEVKDSAGAVVGGLVTSTNNSIEFTPTNHLRYFMRYTVKVLSTVKDVSDNAMAADYIYTFDTGAPNSKKRILYDNAGYNTIRNPAVLSTHLNSGKMWVKSRSGWSVSEDNGTTFSAISTTTRPTLSSDRITELYIDNNIMIFGGIYAGYEVSLDGGATFTNKVSTMPAPIRAERVLTAMALDTSTYILSLDMGVYKVTGGGATYTQKFVPPSPVIALAKSGSNLYALSISHGLHMSYDNGETWVDTVNDYPVYNPVGNNFGVFTDGMNVYLSNGSGFYISRGVDAANSLKAQSFEQIAVPGGNIFSSYSDGEFVFVGSNLGLTILKFGATQFTSGNTSGSHDISVVAHLDSGDGLPSDRVDSVNYDGTNLFLGTPNGLVIGTFNRTTYATSFSVRTTTNYIASANGYGAANGMTTGNGKTYYATDDSVTYTSDGLNFQRFNVNTTDWWQSTTDVKFAGTRLFIGTPEGLEYTADDGASLNTYSLGGVSSLHQENDDIIVVWTSGEVWHIDSNSLNLVNSETLLAGGRRSTLIDDLLYIPTASGLNIYDTGDYTITSHPTFAGMYVWAVSGHGSRVLVSTYANGLWISNDRGATFTQLGAAAGLNVAASYESSYTYGDTIIVFSNLDFISTMHCSVDGGASFQTHSGLFGSLERSTQIIGSGTDLSFFTYGATFTAVP